MESISKEEDDTDMSSMPPDPCNDDGIINIDPNTLFSLPYEDLLNVSISMLKSFSHLELIAIARNITKNFIEQQTHQILENERRREASKKAHAKNTKRNNSIWEYRYNLLKEFKEKNGHCMVPMTYAENQELAKFVTRMRKDNGQNILCPRRKQLLNDIGFKWRGTVDSWPIYYEQLVEYKKENGNTCVPCNYPPNQQLGKWVTSQRQKYELYERKYPHRIEALNKIGFVWRVTSAEFAGLSADERWEKQYQKLLDYQAEQGTLSIPRKHGLSGWCKIQRRLYHDNKLLQDRREKLDKIGFDWKSGEGKKALDLEGMDKSQMWEYRYNQLLEYKREFGDCAVPQHFSKNKSLGEWVKTQRKQHVLKKLPSDRQQKLDKIGFQWVVLNRKKKDSTDASTNQF